jgi:hypothetical protein
MYGHKSQSCNHSVFKDSMLENDPDCPLLTPEQLAEFHPVNYATMEERAQVMREAGIFNPEMVEQKA